MLTYNQEDFIADTIKSVLMQKTNFPFQLVIGEDGSQDKTAEICRHYAKKYGDKIKLLAHSPNIGLIQNFLQTYKACSGEYVAILDGDDYWTDPLKLQKQVDFLDTHPDHSIVCTGFKKLYPSHRLVSKDYSKIKEVTDFSDLVYGNYICSATVMFRNKNHEKDLPDWLGRFPYGDWPIYLWSTRKGEKIGLLRDETAIYRMEIVVSEKLKKVHSEIVQVNLQILECVNKDQNFNSYLEEIKKSLLDHKFELMAAYLRERKVIEYFRLFIPLLLQDPVRSLRSSAYVLKRSFQTN